jgi:euchromatic histone-lysine N-methyltransferase
MLPRPDLDHMHRHLPDRAEPAAAARGEEEEEEEHFVLCARDKGNVARYINHSCEPNLYVQPILMGHTDTRHVAIGLVAMHDIPPFTPLRSDTDPSGCIQGLGPKPCLLCSLM